MSPHQTPLGLVQGVFRVYILYGEISGCLRRSLTLQVFDDSSQAVAVGSDENPLPLLDLRNDFLVPEGQSSSDSVLQALTRGQLVLRQVAVATVLQRHDVQRLNMREETLLLFKSLGLIVYAVCNS